MPRLSDKELARRELWASFARSGVFKGWSRPATRRLLVIHESNGTQILVIEYQNQTGLHRFFLSMMIIVGESLRAWILKASSSFFL